MTDDMQDALTWFKGATNQWYEPRNSEKHRATILRLLDRPVMPKGSEVPNEVLNKMLHEFHYGMGMRAAVDVLHAHLTAPPQPQKVERWLVLDSDGDLLGVYRSLAEAGDENWTGEYSIVHMVEADDDQ